MDIYTKIPEDSVIEKTAEALKKNQFDVHIVANGEEAKEKALSLIPKDAEIQNNTSITLEETGIVEAIRNSGEFDSVHNKIMSLDREKDAHKMAVLRSAPEWIIGSAHFVTEEGHIVIVSNSGSNLPGPAYGASHVILVIGAQKLVKTYEEGMKRVYEHTLPLESIRARKAYGLPETWDSFVSKVLILNKEPVPGQTTVILVKETLGY